MAIVLDYTSRISPSILKAANAIGVCRYLSPLVNKTAWKRITQKEYDELISNGIQVTLNWEYDARDWLGGATRGADHGLAAGLQAQRLGYPKGSVIVGSADFDMTWNQWVMAGRSYSRAFGKAIRNAGYRPGVYGPYDVLQWCRDDWGTVGGDVARIDAFWQSMSRAHSQGRNANPFPGGHLWQHGKKYFDKIETDWNEIRIMPLWGSETVEVSEGIEDLMSLYMVKQDGDDNPSVDFYNDRGELRGHVLNEDKLAAYKAAGIPYLELDADAYATFTTPVSTLDFQMPSAGQLVGEAIKQLKGDG